MFNRPRIIPSLLINDKNLVKTIQFKNPTYLGDPINAVKIYNEKKVDELCVLDITAHKNEIDFDFLHDIATEAFMPLSYGGGINSLDEAKKLYRLGFEKLILNTAVVENPELVKKLVQYAGAQSIVASIDVKKELFGKENCYILCGKKKIKIRAEEMAKMVERLGVGEIFLNSINRDGKMQGYDLELVKRVTAAVNIPVVACGGAGDIDDLRKVIYEGGAHAAAAGSIFVYYGVKKAVLINYPTEQELIARDIFKE